MYFFFFFQAEDGIRDWSVTGVQTCALPIYSGFGMTEATRAKIFEPFFTTKTDKGSGLGLSVTYGIVSRHGGTVDVESTAGEGTSVTICLPIAPEPPAPAKTTGVGSRIRLIGEDATDG